MNREKPGYRGNGNLHAVHGVRPTELGFTLVELMVAITGGLFVSMVVFALARDGSRFYQRESRVAEATLGNVVAFDRLEHDIARAGFLSTPNLTKDPLYCGDATTIKQLPAQLQNLASIRIDADSIAANNATLKTAGRTPESITLSGAFNSVDRYESWHVDISDTGYTVRLQTRIGALLRQNFATLPVASQTTILSQIFPTGRAIRLLNVDTGTFQISTIAGTRMLGGEAYIDLPATPVLNIAGQQRCGLRGTTLVNVINVVKYALQTVRGNTTDFPNYQQLFATGNQPYEADRLELVRQELDSTGTPIVGTQEVIAEYAVDLQFALTTLENAATVPSFATWGFDVPGTVESIAGTTSASAARPQNIRAVRARLSVRSREVDRQENVVPSSNVATGLYRIQITDAATKTSGFARVRTLQSDIVIPSQLEVRW